MRVISGSAKGRPLKGPPGSGTRPMTDMVKEALFNILTPFGFEDALVLDLYAGTGALGIEALSRGAAHADFVEQNHAACRNIEGNLESTGLAVGGKVHCRSVAEFITHPPHSGDGIAKYDIIFADPPYAAPDIAEIITVVDERGLLAAEGVLVVGHSARLPLEDSYGRLTRIRHRSYGDSDFTIYTLKSLLPTGEG
jgi:16S rRNA (guanine966-N2)-methyltransferase